MAMDFSALMGGGGGQPAPSPSPSPTPTPPSEVKVTPSGQMVGDVQLDIFDMPGMGSAQIAMLYGDSGNWKTTQLTTVVEYIYLKTGLPTRVVTGEASCVEAMRPLAQEGMVQILFVLPSMKPRAAMMKLIRGEWLYYFEDAQCTRMLPPGQFSQFMDWRSPVNGQPKYAPVAEKDLKGCGGYIFEGATTLAELCMQALASNRELYAKILAGKKNQDGQEMATGLSAPGYEEDGEMLGQHDKSHYGAIQADALKWIRTSPKELFRWSGGSVKYVFWSSHEAKGVDDFDKTTPIFGPALVGKAGGDKLQKEVGTMIHADSVIKPDGTKEVRFYFVEHQDPGMSMITWQAKPRMTPTPEALAKLNKKYPGGYFVPTAIGAQNEVSLRTFLEFMDQLEEESRGSRKGRLDAIRKQREQMGAEKVKPVEMVVGVELAPPPPVQTVQVQVEKVVEKPVEEKPVEKAAEPPAPAPVQSTPTQSIPVHVQTLAGAAFGGFSFPMPGAAALAQGKSQAPAPAPAPVTPPPPAKPPKETPKAEPPPPKAAAKEAPEVKEPPPAPKSTRSALLDMVMPRQ